MKIFLIGFMGSGKTTTGQLLAEKLNYTFFDTDILLEEKFRCSIADIFKTYGEKEFRKAEQNLLFELASKHQNAVISTGGGLPCFFNNMAFMNKTGLTIYLKLSPLHLFERLKDETNIRPLLQGITSLKTYIKKTLNEREPFYSMSEYILKIERSHTPEHICNKIAEKVSMRNA